MYYTRTNIKTRIATLISGEISDADQNILINRAVTEIISDADLRTQKRRTPLTPNLFDDVYQFTCPADLKGRKICDIQPQIKRGRFDDWRLTTSEEFDRMKSNNREDIVGDPIKIGRFSWSGDNIIAIDEHDYIKKILVSRPVDDFTTAIDPCDTLGSWVAFGDGSNIVLDSSNYVKGSACLKYDISAAGGTTAGIQNSSISTKDLTNYLMEGSIFVWAYITSTTNITNFKLRLGSNSSNYNEMTATTTNEGTVFSVGWNLLRFDLSALVATGSPVNTAITYCAIYMTKAAGKISEVSYRFDDIVLKKGAHYDLAYYSKYGWQSAAGVYKQDSDDNGDYINADIDEIAVFELKYTHLAEKHLRNAGAASTALAEYLAKVKDYQIKNPSEALIMTSTYSNIYPFPV